MGFRSHDPTRGRATLSSGIDVVRLLKDQFDQPMRQGFVATVEWLFVNYLLQISFKLLWANVTNRKCNTESSGKPTQGRKSTPLASSRMVRLVFETARRNACQSCPSIATSPGPENPILSLSKGQAKDGFAIPVINDAVSRAIRREIESAIVAAGGLASNDYAAGIVGIVGSTNRDATSDIWIWRPFYGLLFMPEQGVAVYYGEVKSEGVNGIKAAVLCVGAGGRNDGLASDCRVCRNVPGPARNGVGRRGDLLGNLRFFTRQRAAKKFASRQEAPVTWHWYCPTGREI
ncbi:hypothetical protein BC832DRAFT_536378 [Gaertneriomyces semiglobifer]|nr:hypothetical protein BC832DRAFT_536378 [Gaertneriomyces semiglobifer]